VRFHRSKSKAYTATAFLILACRRVLSIPTHIAQFPPLLLSCSSTSTLPELRSPSWDTEPMPERSTCPPSWVPALVCRHVNSSRFSTGLRRGLLSVSSISCPPHSELLQHHFGSILQGYGSLPFSLFFRPYILSLSCPFSHLVVLHLPMAILLTCHQYRLHFIAWCSIHCHAKGMVQPILTIDHC
jgi:hypothetical protein